MNSTLLIKLLGGLTATAGVGTGGYLLKEHFKKSEEKSKEVKTEQQPSVTPSEETPSSSVTDSTDQAQATPVTQGAGEVTEGSPSGPQDSTDLSSGGAPSSEAAVPGGAGGAAAASEPEASVSTDSETLPSSTDTASEATD